MYFLYYPILSDPASLGGGGGGGGLAELRIESTVLSSTGFLLNSGRKTCW